MSIRWLTRPRGGDAPRSLFATSQGRGAKVRRRLVLDALEDRCLLATLTLQPSVLAGTAGQPIATPTPTPPTLPTPVATFFYGNNTATTSNFSVSIDWGNGVSNFTGFVTQPGGVGTVYYAYAGTALLPGYTYPQAGTYTVPVEVDALDGSLVTATVNSTANIADTQITNAFVTPIAAQEQGQAFTSQSGTVATFSNGNPLSTPSDFIATIDWGDGAQTQGQINLVLDSNSVPTGNYTVTTMTPHTYTAVGTFPVSVQIISLGGSRATASTFSDGTTATVQVIAPPVVDATTPAMAVTGVAGVSFTGLVGAFTQFAGSPTTAFQATIDWGDGSTTTEGVITIDAALVGTFDVSGTHTYANFGTYDIVVTVDVLGTTTSGTLANTATITDVPLSGVGETISGVAGFLYSGPVATFTSPNLLAQASEFLVSIDWGDGTVPSAGTVSGGDGSFTASGEHVYANPAALFTTTITITHTSFHSANVGTVLTLTGSTHVLVPVDGAMSRASDSGVSDSDGITRVTQPIFLGTGEPGATIQILAAPAGSGSGGTQVGAGTIDATGNWTIQISPLGDGSYTCFAQMVDPGNGSIVQTVVLPVTPSGGTTLVVDTAGPTVASVLFSPRQSQLQVVLQDSLAGLNPAGLTVSRNFQLAAPSRAGLTPYAVRSLVVDAGGAGQSVVTLKYNLGTRIRTGAYVVTLSALGLSDLAGNILVEKTLVAFPQTTNSPNPNYIAEIDVARNFSTSAPKQYISIAEQQAAAAYSLFAGARKVVRVPPRPSPFRRAVRR